MYSRKAVNTQRQFEFDLCKAFAIIYMIFVHVYECIYLKDLVPPTAIWEHVISFVGGPLAAPVFMFLLGAGIVYSKHSTPREIFFRGLRLFIFSYILNFVRFSIPYFIRVALNGEFNVSFLLYVSLDVDILQFAGLAFMFTALLKRFIKNVNFYVLIAFGIQIIGIILDHYLSKQFSDTALGYILGLFFYTGDGAFFPFLVWYIYPALGICFANILIHIKDLDTFYKKIFIVASVLLAALCSTLHFVGYDMTNFYSLYDDIYYRQNFLYVMFTILVILIALSSAHFVHKLIHFEKVDKVIRTMSTNLNVIFIIQWLIIGPMMHGAQIFLSSAWLIIPVSLGILVIGVLLSILYKRLVTEVKKHRKAKTS